mgnify:CR=1 FL=1|tara:strand:- start:210 stop:2081 length:1872 start_codon:yes stop_codon:yes gene_type:complete
MFGHKKNKKALIYNIVLVLIAFAALTSALIIISNKGANLGAQIGSRQAKIIQTYQEAEKTLYFVEKLTEYSLYTSFIEINKKAGYIENSDCKTFNKVSLWTEKKSEKEYHDLIKCFPINEEGNPEIFFQQFNKLFKENLNKYLENNKFELNNHKIEIKEIKSEDINKNKNIKLQIIGKAILPITLDFDTNIIKQEKEIGSVEEIKYVFEKWPVNNPHQALLSCHGSYDTERGFNHGIIIKEDFGEPTYPVEKGKVYSFYNKCKQEEPCPGSKLGNYVVVEHDKKLFTIYGNLFEVDNSVKKDKVIEKTQRLGLTGQNGLSFMVITNTNDLRTMTNSKSPLCYFANSRIESLKSFGDSCKVKYPEGLISKEKSLNLAKECEDLGYVRITDKVKINTKDESKNYYSFKPSFDIILNYSLDDYRTSIDFSNKILENCPKEQDVEKCIKKINKNDFNEMFELGTCDTEDEIDNIPEDFYKQRKINLCYRTNTRFPFQEQPDIDFALYIPDKVPPPWIEDQEPVVQYNPLLKAVEIVWNGLDMDTKDPIKDVKYYHLHRSVAPFYDTRFAEIVTTIESKPKQTYNYKDYAISPGIYHYAVIAEDLFGNKKEIVPVLAIKRVIVSNTIS